MWLVVHLVFLTGFENRATALFSWISLFGRFRYERTITLRQVLARRALQAATLQSPIRDRSSHGIPVPADVDQRLVAIDVWGSESRPALLIWVIDVLSCRA